MSVIDRKARQEMHDLTRQLLTGRLTNHDYERRIPQSADPAIEGIHADGVWYLYDDMREHRLSGKDALSPQQRHEVARWLLFLDTDLKYEWPVLHPCLRPLVFVMSILTLGLAGYLLRALLSIGGDKAVWPFYCASDLEMARRSPRFLSGSIRPVGLRAENPRIF